jgi:predicted phosphodiesterase
VSSGRGARLLAAACVSLVAAACGAADDTRRQPSVVIGAQAGFSAGPGAVRFAVIGDSGRGSPEQYELARQMAVQRERFRFEFVIMLGDNVYDGDSPKDYRDKFETPYRPLLENGVKFYAVRGNHDVGEQWLYPPFNTGGNRYFSFRKTGGPIGALTGNEVRFVAIDSVSLDAEQIAWLDRELASADADWTICFFHHPLYTSGRYAWSAFGRRRRLEPILRRHGVDVVFSGHEHIYERLAPQQGIVYFVSGGAGSVRRGDFQPSNVSAAGFDEDLHFMLIEIRGDTMRFEAVTRTGAVVDAGSIEQARPPAALTAVPGGSSASSVRPDARLHRLRR